jgi:predicted ATPase/DNA-binding SARP family transcriptional activator
MTARYGPGVDFRVLGPLEVGDGREPLALGPRKQRALLARLLLDTGRTVSVERLVDDLWGDELPDTAVKMVQIYVSGLRKTLPADRLQTRPPGYCLELARDDELDLRRFEALTGAGRTALAQGDAAGAAERLRAALALWRGPALAEFASEPFARVEGARLEELQLAALEDRIEADLGLGRAGDLVGELERLVAGHPLRERLHGQLMLALYRTGRQGEALAAYHALRGVLREQLGLDPSPRLRALEQAILTQDAGLEACAAGPAPAPDAPPGRAEALGALRAAYDASAAGARRLVLVSGEPGIGKRTLVEALLSGLGQALVIRGHCVEQRGAGEAYLPLLDGLSRAAEHEPRVVEVLAARAPSWLAELPWLSAGTPDVHARASPGRMLRELVDALEALAAEAPVVLVLEDLQWADPSTRDVLAALLRRRHPARVLVVATATGGDRLAGELRLRGTAQELALGPLSAQDAVAAFGLQPGPAARLARRAGGNPLFMRHLLSHLQATGSLDGMPETLRDAVHARLAGLADADLELLRAAAVDGREFTAAGVAAALGRPVADVAVPGVVHAAGLAEWPDGTSTAAYAFVHTLHRDALLETVPPAQRAEMHRRIGKRLEAAFGTDQAEAPRIAAHYLAGRMPGPALRFLRLSARACARRGAYREAMAHLREGLDAAAALTDGPECRRARIELLSELGQAHVAIDGWSSPEALECLELARAEAEPLGDKEPLASVLLALATLREVRGEPEPALAAAQASAALAGDTVEGAELLACALFHQGAFTRALEHADRGATLEQAGADAHYTTFPATLGDNAGVSCHDWAALSLWFLGRMGEASRRAARALELSQEPGRAYSAATARAQLAALHACRGEPEAALRWAQATIDAGRERGFAYRVAMGRVLRGWARAGTGDREGAREIACGIEASRATGARFEDPFYLGLLADAHRRGGSHEAGLVAVGEALETATRERAHYYDAELHRLRGELLRAAGEPWEEALREALAVARRQGARSLELRAAISLARALAGGERAAEGLTALAIAHEPLRHEVAPDVRAAAALLAGDDEQRRAPGAERRRITVLAWEVDGLGRLAERLEPQRLAAVIGECHAAARASAAEGGGHVATEDESGGLVYFGYAGTREHAARRAVDASLGLACALRRSIDGVTLELCAGIHSGPVVVGAVGQARLALGQTPRTAWHLAAAARPGEVLVSDATRELCEGAFVFAPRAGGHRVLTRFGARTQRHAKEAPTPLVGRERELALLAGRWEQAAGGLGQALLISGEAGIGKSRLVRELAARERLDRDSVLELRCEPERADTALYPIADHFRRCLAGRSGGIERLLADAGVDVARHAPVVGTLLGPPGPATPDPFTFKQRTKEAVIAYVLARAARRPALVVVEDLHWADPSTIELLGELLAAIGEARALAAVTFRPSLEPPWTLGSQVSHLAIPPCTRREAHELIGRVASLPAEAADAVAERADGVPLLLEELARAASEAGTDTPASLREALAMRLDQLGPAAWVVAQLAAAIGPELRRDVLVAASDMHAGDLEAGIDELVRVALLHRRGRPPELRYAFRHALVHEAVREIPETRARRALHLRIARALERSLPELARTEPERVAAQLELADEPGRAVAYRLDAGRAALARSANAEAIDQLTRGLADLDALPEDERRAELELALRIPLADALLSLRGCASPEAARCFDRARALCQATGDRDSLPAVLYGMWVGALARAEHERALALGHELRECDPEAPIAGEGAAGLPLVFLGRFAEARAALDRIPDRCDAGLRLRYGHDPAVAAMAAGAWALWGCGVSREATERGERAIALGRAADHPPSLVVALGMGAQLAAFLDDPRAARERALETIAIAEELGASLWSALGRYPLAWAELALGEPGRAAATLAEGLRRARAAGAAVLEPFALTVLAQAEAAGGRPGDARRHLDEADAAAARTGERLWAFHTHGARAALA